MSNIQSICVFGSVARGSSDIASDKDVLIVVDSPFREKALIDAWKSDGWSVSVYTPRRFEAIIRSGSLFVQHLKREGLLVEDKLNWLASRLSTARPKLSYLNEAYSSADLAVPIDRFESNLDIASFPIVADLAFVCVRNFAVNYLATDGVYLFDYEHLVSEISLRLGLSTTEQNLLGALRVGKAAYRGRSAAILPPIGTVGQLRSVLNRIFDQHRFQQVHVSTPVRNLGSGYATLRDLEALVVSRLNRVPTEYDLEALKIQRVWKYINQPQDYAWDVRTFLHASSLNFDHVYPRTELSSFSFSPDSSESPN